MSNIATILIAALADKLTNYEKTELLTGFTDLESGTRETIITRTKLVMGTILLGDQEGITITHPSGARSIVLEPSGNAFFGSNVDNPAYTSMAIFAEATKYNNENLGAGDLLVGDNSSSKANLLWDKSTGQLKLRSGTTEGIILDTDGTLQSGNYSSGASGWIIEPDGDAEFNNIVARGTFRTSVFQKDNIIATGGDILVSKNAGEVLTDATTPASGSFTITVKDDDSDDPIAATDDVLRIKGWNGTELIDVWVTVTFVNSATGFTIYTVTLESGASKTIESGMAVVNYGPSGAGLLHLEAGATTTRMRIATHAGSPWTTLTNQVVLGNVRGTFGTGANDRYGIGVGDYSGKNYLSYNAETASEFVLMAGDGAVKINEGGITIFDAGDATSRVDWYYDDSGTARAIGSVFGDYATSGNLWVSAYKSTGDPWGSAKVILEALDYTGGTSNSRVTLDSGGTITMDPDTAVVVIGAGLWVGNGAVATSVGDIVATGDIFTKEWTDYSATSTITGWSSYTEKQLNYKKVGKLVLVQFSIYGTSNSTSTSFTLPFANSSNRVDLLCRAADNGTVVFGLMELSSGGSTSIFYQFPGLGNWTASNQKNIHGEFFYEVA